MELEEVKKLYPPNKPDEYHPDGFPAWECKHDPFLESLGPHLIHMVEDDYQGDIYVVLGEDINGPVRFLNMGFGSCSGCDSFYACETYEELVNLLTSLEADIKEFPSGEALWKHLIDDEILPHYRFDDYFHGAFMPKLGEMLGKEYVKPRYAWDF